MSSIIYPGVVAGSGARPLGKFVPRICLSIAKQFCMVIYGDYNTILIWHWVKHGKEWNGLEWNGLDWNGL